MKNQIIKTKITFDKDADEYCVQAFTAKGRYSAADYFTQDREDAVNTALTMTAVLKTEKPHLDLPKSKQHCRLCSKEFTPAYRFESFCSGKCRAEFWQSN